jgi:hypothetical protein
MRQRQNVFKINTRFTLMNNQRKRGHEGSQQFSQKLSKNTRLSLKDKGCNCEGPRTFRGANQKQQFV